MALNLATIIVFGVVALLFASVIPPRWRGWTVLVSSLIAIYWLQPALPIRYSDFILPTAAICLTVWAWWVTRPPDEQAGRAVRRDDAITLAVIVVIVVGLAFNRFINPDYRITASRPPDPAIVAFALAATVGVVVLSSWLTRWADARLRLTLVLALIVLLFTLLKMPPLAAEVSRVWRAQTGQDTSLASALDLTWLGFSYVAFRLIHTLRDRQTGLLPALSLQEFVSYTLFFPSIVAGPIDRAERFLQDWRSLPDITGLDAARFAQGLTRITFGLMKKFVIADSLASGLSLNAVNAAQAHSTGGLWALLYGYALRLYFDFGGYSDIAIGVGILFGITLPENFNRPYLRTDITAFWQSWHITLSNWARFYVFSPLSRTLLTRISSLPTVLVVLLAQQATMIVIGLWHGVTWNFLIWGVWHGLGLFIHKQWSDRTRKWYRNLNNRPAMKRIWHALAWLVTFHFVALGWVWFGLPDTQLSVRVFARLFGIAAQ